MKKYYYDKTNESVFSITNFEYKMRENQDYEINEEQFIEFLDKRKNFYSAECDIVDNIIHFTYKKDEESKPYLSNKINKHKQYLKDTDYIVTKIAEAQAVGENVSELLGYYSEVLQKRKEVREEINELEAKLKEG